MNEKWTIGEVAKLFDVSTDTLRYYEKSGILSAQKNSENGYRYYSYDEVVVLMDILFFRNMELSVKDIKKIITEMDIGDIKNVLYQNQRIVENRIQELTKLKNMITQAAYQYKLCEERLGEFLIVSAPVFKFKLIGTQAEDLITLIRKYKKEDWIDDRIRYTLLVPQAELMGSPNFSSAQVGISIDEENLYLLDGAEQQELSSLQGMNYLYTIAGTNYSEQENDVLNKALDYLKKQGRQVNGPLIGRYMASSHKDGLDYYEVWIATNP
ncbi:MerR family transcriptional regulator [Sporomusa aerivorans]|uniref:MerR family transcriptional regulator n=1 Tax=Sporomusa aerivorans TaxID=204936 RepID=UPI00352B4132